MTSAVPSPGPALLLPLGVTPGVSDTVEPPGLSSAPGGSRAAAVLASPVSLVSKLPPAAFIDTVAKAEGIITGGMPPAGLLVLLPLALWLVGDAGDARSCGPAADSAHWMSGVAEGEMYELMVVKAGMGPLSMLLEVSIAPMVSWGGFPPLPGWGVTALLVGALGGVPSWFSSCSLTSCTESSGGRGSLEAMLKTLTRGWPEGELTMVKVRTRLLFKSCVKGW